MAKLLSTEDGNLASSIRITTEQKYKDIDLTLSTFSDTGEIYLKRDAAAVKQSVKNLLLTNAYDKPFNPRYGANLQGLLFDLSEGNSDFEINERIKKAINIYEPRAIIQEVRVNSSPERNVVRVRVEFKVKNLASTEVIETTISRLR